MLAEERELVGEERSVEQRDRRLGPGQCQGTKARALAAREDDRLDALGRRQLPGDQGWASSMSMTGMPSRIG